MKSTSQFAVASIVFAACLIVISRTVADADLWGHIRFGQDIVRARAIPTSDPYSYTSGDRFWVNHEWLAEVIVAVVYDASGPRGLIIVKTALGMLIAAVLFGFLRSQELTPVRSGIVLVAVVAGLKPGLQTVRPHLFTYLGFAAVLLVIHAARRDRFRWAFALPGIFAIWANLHGGFLAGLAIVGIWVVVRLYSSRLEPEKARAGLLSVSVLLVAACGVAVLANPYGYRLLTFLLRTATVARPEITEWAPVPLMSTLGLTYLVLVCLTGLGIAYGRHRRSIESVVMLAAMALAPLAAVRHLPLFSLTVGFIGGPLIGDAWNRWKSGTSSPQRRLGHPALFVAASVVGVLLALPNFRCIQTRDPLPVNAVELLKRSEVEGNLAVSFDWGEYVIWHRGPHIRVSTDGRRETVYSDRARLEALDFEYGRGDWDAVLRAGADMALVERQSAAGNLLRLANGWTLAYEDDVSRLFVRRGSRQAQKIGQSVAFDVTAQQRPACFP